MALYDDKRFILSHIRHSFITCDDTGMCETVMMPLDSASLYPRQFLIHHPFEYDSDQEYDWYEYLRDEMDAESKKNAPSTSTSTSKSRSSSILSNNKKRMAKTRALNDKRQFASADECELFRATDPVYRSELTEDVPAHSFDIMSDSFNDMLGTRRRSNTAQRLEKLRKDRKIQSKTKVVMWKSPTKLISVHDGETNQTSTKRIVLNTSSLTAQEIAMLEFDQKENVYYETEAYRRHLFPIMPEFASAPTISTSPDGEASTASSSNTSAKDKKKSSLTLQIERSPNAPVNPFNDYTRFDGRVAEGNANIKRIRIFFAIHEQDEEFHRLDFTKSIPGLLHSGINCGTNWIEIVCLLSARVSDVIGLICWHYTHLSIGPPLKTDPGLYALKIAEENGDVDNDFPCLTATDDIKRYGFPYLALVEIELNIEVKIEIESENVFSTISVTSPATTLQEIIDQLKKRRIRLFRPWQDLVGDDLDRHFRLELFSKPGIALDLASPIGQYIEPNQSRACRKIEVRFLLKLVNLNPSAISGVANLHNVGENATTTTSTTTNAENQTTSSGSGATLSSSFNSKAVGLLAGGLRTNRHSSIALFHYDDTSSGSGKDFASTSAHTLPIPGGSTAGATSQNMATRKLRNTKDWSQNMLDMMEAPIYQCFEVMAVNKLVNTPVEMGISGTKVEVTPKPSHSRSPSTGGGFTEKLFSRFNSTKAVNIDVEDVVDCEALHSNKIEMLGRQQFKLVYFNGTDFKSQKFESDVATVDDILFKLANVMKMRTSVRRNEYQAIKSRKKSISSRIYFKPKLMLASTSGSSSSSDCDSSSDEQADSSGLGEHGGSSLNAHDDLYFASTSSTLTRGKKDSATSSTRAFRKFKSSKR